MSDILRAMGIAAGILFPVVVLIVIISIVAVKRGEAGHGLEGHGVTDSSVHVSAAPAKTGKAAAPAAEEVSIALILVYGTGLFVLTILGLFVVSIISHRG